MTGQKQSYKHAISKRCWRPFAHLRSISLQWNLQNSFGNDQMPFPQTDWQTLPEL
jgi:hypothetical protein